MPHPAPHPARPTTTIRRARRRSSAAVVAALAGLAATPLAAQTTYFGQTPGDAAAARAAFGAALGVVVTTPLTGVAGSTIPFGALGAATVTNGTIGSGSIFAPSASQATPLTFSFSQALNGFGATFSDVGSCCGNAPFPLATLQLTFLSGATVVGTVSRQFAVEGALRAAPAFFGVTGLAAFDRVEVRGNTGDFYNVLDPAVGTAPGQTPPPPAVVPEPGAFALVAAGLGVLAAAGARRRGAHS